MIMPTWRAVWLAATGVPVSLVAGLAEDGLWVAGPAWIAAAALLLGADAALCRRPRAFRLLAELPGTIEVGRTATLALRFEGRPPPVLEAALDADDRLDVQPATLRIAGAAPAGFALWPRRRGTAALSRLFLRWDGPLGLVRRVEARPLGRSVAIVPQIAGVREQAMRLFSRDRRDGTATVRDLAGSAEFHALREFQPGDDRRAVNWRQSARHVKLLVRETEAERNRTITVALDTGRLMSEPLAGGLPRLDHALNAALMLAYTALKMGDRVGLYAFDAKPVLASRHRRRAGRVRPAATPRRLARLLGGGDQLHPRPHRSQRRARRPRPRRRVHRFRRPDRRRTNGRECRPPAGAPRRPVRGVPRRRAGGDRRGRTRHRRGRRPRRRRRHPARRTRRRAGPPAPPRRRRARGTGQGGRPGADRPLPRPQAGGTGCDRRTAQPPLPAGTRTRLADAGRTCWPGSNAGR